MDTEMTSTAPSFYHRNRTRVPLFCGCIFLWCVFLLLVIFWWFLCVCQILLTLKINNNKNCSINVKFMYIYTHINKAYKTLHSSLQQTFVSGSVVTQMLLAALGCHMDSPCECEHLFFVQT